MKRITKTEDNVYYVDFDSETEDSYPEETMEMFNDFTKYPESFLNRVGVFCQAEDIVIAMFAISIGIICVIFPLIWFS